MSKRIDLSELNMSLITTSELCARAGQTRNQLNWRRRMFPDRLSPSRKIGRSLMWDESLVAVLIGLPLRRPLSR